MNKQIRQYVGLLSAILVYYLVHEGAHFVYALSAGVFQRINFMGLGVQVAVASERMSNLQLGIFCLVGAAATAITACVLTLAAPRICMARSRVFRACMFYITMAMLLIDPLYLSVLCGFFGGGDMNGIALLLPEWIARLCFGVLLVIHCLLLWIAILPKYRKPFAESSTQ